MQNINKQQPTLTLHLTLEEVNAILSALGEQPYVKVFQLVQKIQQQASGQLEQKNSHDGSDAIVEHTELVKNGQGGT